jgi:hypothetical protein
VRCADEPFWASVVQMRERAMMKYALALGAALFLTTGTAHAGNCSSYQCGKIEVHSCYVKPSYNNNKFASHQATINIPEGMQNKTRRGNSTSGAFIQNDITGTTAYYLNGKRYRCKDVTNEK